MTAAAGWAARWVHLGAAVALVGTATMLLLAGRPTRHTARAWQARMLRWMQALTVLALAGGIVVLVWQASQLFGRPPAAVDPAALRRVLLDTRFGHVWLIRQGLLLLLAAFLTARPATETTLDWIAARAQASALAALALALGAASGHAAALKADAAAVMANDAVHAVAAGAWLGALAPLAALLRASAGEAGADARPYAVIAAHRLSRLALGAVLVLAATGSWNALVHVGGVAALVGTPYGRLLLVKLALISLLLAAAALNRRRLLPAVGGEASTVGRPAMRRLALFVSVEAALGALVLAVVAAMAATPPGKHEPPVWPFPFRLTLGALGSVSTVSPRALVGSQLAVLGLAAGIAAFLVVRRRALVVAAAGALWTAGLVLLLPSVLAEAYPTTFVRPAVPYTAASLARGAALYREHCAACHGPARTADGVPPPALSAGRLQRRTAGDLYWWITRGVPRVGMPGVGAALTEEERWDLVNFVRALGAAETTRSRPPALAPADAAAVAPDFTFGVGPMPPRTLKDYRGRRIVLLVLYSLPASRPRLAQLGQQYELLGVLGAEVIAVPRDADPHAIRRLGAEPRILFPVVTDGAEDIVAAYDLFGAGSHAEFLIDRRGFIRARSVDEAGAQGDAARLLDMIQALNAEKPSVAEAAEHVH